MLLPNSSVLDSAKTDTHPHTEEQGIPFEFYRGSMEPRPFARLSVGSLGLRPLVSSNDSTAATPSSSSSTLLHEAGSHSDYFCKVKLSHFGSQTVTLPLLPASVKVLDTDPHQAASFYLDETGLSKLLSGSLFSKKPSLCVTVYSSARQNLILPCYSTGSSRRFSGNSIGKFDLPVGVELASPKSGFYLHNGWVSIGKTAKVELHLSVKVELDPRYIFQFDGQPELSPQIVQIQGNIRQPIFSCKFTRDRSFRSRASQMDGGYGWDIPSNNSMGGKDREKKERKGWLVLIYDLSGSPVAAASMVTPFVPSAGSDRVSRANPGAWLIMKAGPAGEDSWVPWGRLEAWREKGSRGGLGCRFQLIAEGGGVNFSNNNYGSLLVSESIISTQRGGDFMIDMAKLKPDTPASASPVESPHSSGDLHYYNNAADSSAGGGSGGFVMSANVQGEGKTSKPPHVQLAMRHVTTIEDAAVFMALAAAVDLSMDACLPFSKKLGKNFVARP